MIKTIEDARQALIESGILDYYEGKRIGHDGAFFIVRQCGSNMINLDNGNDNSFTSLVKYIYKNRKFYNKYGVYYW